MKFSYKPPAKINCTSLLNEQQYYSIAKQFGDQIFTHKQSFTYQIFAYRDFVVITKTVVHLVLELQYTKDVIYYPTPLRRNLASKTLFRTEVNIKSLLGPFY